MYYWKAGHGCVCGHGCTLLRYYIHHCFQLFLYQNIVLPWNIANVILFLIFQSISFTQSSLLCSVFNISFYLRPNVCSRELLAPDAIVWKIILLQVQKRATSHCLVYHYWCCGRTQFTKLKLTVLHASVHTVTVLSSAKTVSWCFNYCGKTSCRDKYGH